MTTPDHCTECDGNGYHTPDCPNAAPMALTCDSSPEAFARLTAGGPNWGLCSGPVTHIDRKGYAYCEKRP